MNFIPKTSNSNIKKLYIDGGNISSDPLEINFLNNILEQLQQKLKTKLSKQIKTSAST